MGLAVTNRANESRAKLVPPISERGQTAALNFALEKVIHQRQE